MRKFTLITTALLTLPIFANCNNNEVSKRVTLPQYPYSYGEEVATISNPILNEVSGMVASPIYHNCFYLNNDGGDEANIYLIDTSGEIVATLHLPAEVTNRDWEGIALGDGYIYIGEVGDNEAIYPNKVIYRIEEPTDIDITKFNQVINIESSERMEFNFEGEQRDCETLAYDPITKELVMLSKREEQILLYTTPFIATSTNERLTLPSSLKLNFTMATAGDISPAGDKILIKTYTHIYYWDRLEGEPLTETLSRTPTPMAYLPEPQGEAIAWSASEDSFYTLSEKVGSASPLLYIYRAEE